MTSVTASRCSRAGLDYPGEVTGSGHPRTGAIRRKAMVGGAVEIAVSADYEEGESEDSYIDLIALLITTPLVILSFALALQSVNPTPLFHFDSEQPKCFEMLLPPR